MRPWKAKGPSVLERDYLMRLLMELAVGIRRAIGKTADRRYPGDSAAMLDAAVANAVDFDGEMFLGLAPESVAGILNVSGTDERVAEYIARSLLLASEHYRAAGDNAVALLRRAQALAVADAYGIGIGAQDSTDEAMLRFLDERQNTLRFE